MEFNLPIRYWWNFWWGVKVRPLSILLCACYDCVCCVCERCAWNDGGSAPGCDNQVPGRQIANLDPDSFPLTRLVIRCLGSSHTHTHCNNAGNGVWSWLPPPRRRWSRLWEPRRRRWWCLQEQALTRRWLGLGGSSQNQRGKFGQNALLWAGRGSTIRPILFVNLFLFNLLNSFCQLVQCYCLLHCPNHTAGHFGFLEHFWMMMHIFGWWCILEWMVMAECIIFGLWFILEWMVMVKYIFLNNIGVNDDDGMHIFQMMMHIRLLWHLACTSSSMQWMHICGLANSHASPIYVL